MWTGPASRESMTWWMVSQLTREVVQVLMDEAYLADGALIKLWILLLPGKHGWKFSGLFLNSGFWGWHSIESQRQNTELGRLQSLFWYIYSLSKGNQPFKLEILKLWRHTASFKIWISKVQDFGNFELSPNGESRGQRNKFNVHMTFSKVFTLSWKQYRLISSEARW